MDRRIERVWRLSGWLCAGAALGAFSAASVAQAQEAAPAVDEVVITAQKRTERLQDVPVSVAVVSGSKLEQLHISGPDELPLIAPSVSFTSSQNTRGQGVSIRGVGTLNFSDGVEPSVSTVIDGVVLGRQAMSVFDLIDVDRVEILRGPQGTLFGKNSSAGVLNIVTAAPSATFGGKAEVSYATLNEVKARATVTGPIIGEMLTGRLTAYSTTRDGYITNVHDGDKLNDQGQWGVRGKLLFRPDEKTDITIIGDYSSINRNCCAPTAISVSPSAAGALRASLMFPVVPSADNDQVNVDGAYFLKQNAWGLSAEANRQLGGFTLTSITAYREFQVFDNNDPDLLPINVFNQNSANQHQNQFSEELRITSPSGRRIEYVGGFFYFNQDVSSVTRASGTFSPTVATLQGSLVDRAINTENYAAFGQVTGHVTDRFALTVGGRYTKETLDGRFARSTLPGLVATPASVGGPPLSVTGLTSDESKLSYRFAAQYEFDPNAMVYASYARGFKGAAINLLNTLSSALVANGGYVVPPEIPTNYETGVRTSFFGRRLQLNTTAFLTDFKGFQTTAFDPTLNANTLTSAGALRTKGVEVEALALPLPGLTLTTNVAYTDATFRRFPNGPCYPGETLVSTACHTVAGAFVQDLAGKRLNNSPKWAYTLGANYLWPLGFHDLSGVFSGNYVFRDKVNFSISQDPRTVQKSYGLVNFSLGVQTPGEGWKISIFAKNLFDKRYSNFIFPATLDSGGPAAQAGYSQITTEDARRIIGVALNSRF